MGTIALHMCACLYSCALVRGGSVLLIGKALSYYTVIVRV